MGNIAAKHYGVGQPSAYYKDGKFYVIYCYVIAGVHEMRVAESTDGINFGPTDSHPAIGLRNAAGVKYNAETEKFMLVQQFSDNLYVLETDDIYNWPTTDVSKLPEYGKKLTDNTTQVLHFPDFVTDELGHIHGKTVYVTCMTGKKSATGDWRAEHSTWDGFVTAFNPDEFKGDPIILPDGNEANEETLKKYANRNTRLDIPTGQAIYRGTNTITIDGNRDAIYTDARRIVVNRGVYAWGSNISPTWGEAWFAWDEDNIYGFIQVHDPAIHYAYNIFGNMANMWRRDSVDVFIDPPNDHTGTEYPWDIDQFIVSVGANNQDFFIKGDGEVNLTNSEGMSYQWASRLTQTGYNIEFRVSWLDDYQKQNYIYEGACIGLDIQINDDMGGGVGREALIVWSDHRGDAFRFTERFGDLYLIK